MFATCCKRFRIVRFFVSAGEPRATLAINMLLHPADVNRNACACVRGCFCHMGNPIRRQTHQFYYPPLPNQSGEFSITDHSETVFADWIYIDSLANSSPGPATRFPAQYANVRWAFRASISTCQQIIGKIRIFLFSNSIYHSVCSSLWNDLSNASTTLFDGVSLHHTNERAMCVNTHIPHTPHVLKKTYEYKHERAEFLPYFHYTDGCELVSYIFVCLHITCDS